MKPQAKILIGTAVLAGALTVAMYQPHSDAQVSASVQINARADFEAPLAP